MINPFLFGIIKRVKKMKDVKEIVLFFKDSIIYTPLDVAQDLLGRYPELGNPLILPVKNNKRAPLLVFNENADLQIQANFSAVTIVFNRNYFDKMSSIIFDIVDAFELVKAEFKRIGYVSSVFMSPKYVSKIKDKFLDSEEIEDVKEINLSWYRQLKLDKAYINCWERFITDTAHFNDLLCQYDFNTPIDKSICLDMKYIKEFVRVADEFVESRIEKL